MPITRVLTHFISLYGDGGSDGTALYNPAIAPTQLFDALYTLHPVFREVKRDTQQDADEVITFLLSSLNDELVKGV